MTRKSRKKNRIRARAARQGVPYSVAARRSSTEQPQPQRIRMIVVGGRQLSCDVPLYELTCVAATVRGARCKSPVERHGQVARFDVVGRYRVDWAADEPFWIARYGSPERMAATFLEQRCLLHVGGGRPDAVPREVHDIGPLVPLASDAADEIGRRTRISMQTARRHGYQPMVVADWPDLTAELAAARAGDITRLLEVATAQPLPRSLSLDDIRGAPFEPRRLNAAALWWSLLEAREEGLLSDDQLGQCLAASDAIGDRDGDGV
ncbi:hypothetical protein IU436_28360 [Nocardia farcinica]|uniref:hypothetical protein n=1 Tax=Nocardia farcinica TaxID=37329 RepID=UPI001894DB4F|nr:hypothetical protein [Nocardia farcinica]MBF6422593.1 hypothetical protein [Nocardia farcinica]MBF6434251.1 hypothetical protein [Nocardia farcinica]MBF6505335.1 hypothetical protein [Nocardia farcinica]